MATLPVRRERSNNGCGRRDLRRLVAKFWCGGMTRVLPPVLGCEIHQVHARGVAGIDRGVGAREQRGEKRADEMHASGRTIVLGRSLEEAPDLRTGEPLERTRARTPREHI